jgi:hypothetical protein
MVDFGRGGVQAGGLSEITTTSFEGSFRIARLCVDDSRRGRKPMHEHTEHLAHFLD